MQTYKAPLRDMRFVLHELHGDTKITDLPGCGDFTPELVDSILEEAGKVAEEVLLPLNASGERGRVPLRERRGAHAEGTPGRLPYVPRGRLDRDRLRS